MQILRVAAFLALVSPLGGQIVGGSVEEKSRIDGLRALDQVGYAVAAAGDVDGDGVGDYLLGAPFADPGGRPAAGAAALVSGASGQRLFTWRGAANVSFLGYSVAGAGDVDGDGVADIILGAPEEDPGGLEAAGSAFVHSGADGSLILRLDGSDGFDYLGTSVAAAGDVNGDGFGDVLVGAPLTWPNGIREAGSAYVFSGADGSVLLRFDGVAEIDELGGAVAGGGDLDGDGVCDAVVGAGNADPFDLGSEGLVRAHSGADGSELWSFSSPEVGNQLGLAVAILGDVDGDGRNDVVAGAPSASPGGVPGGGSAFVLSGATGALLLRVDGTEVVGRLGASVADAGDLDLDGRPEVALGVPGSGAGRVIVLDALTGATVLERAGEAAGERFGSSVCSPGDLDADGFPELLAGAIGADPGGRFDAGSARVFGVDPFLCSSADSLSAAAGGSIEYRLDFPEDVAGAPYLLLVTGSGTGANTLNGVPFPLEGDALLDKTLARRFPSYATGFRGYLDAQGRATASLHPRPGRLPASFVGRTFHLAAVAGAPDHSSVARTLTVLP